MLKIRLNGEPYELTGPTTVGALLQHLGIDSRRVAVERNVIVVKRAEYDATPVVEGDEIEVVNFVGGGSVERARRRRAPGTTQRVSRARGRHAH